MTERSYETPSIGTATLKFDVFLSHNSQDKPAVEALARQLEDKANLKVWLDKWNLVPGEPWQEALEEALDLSSTCAVFIGPSGIGPWHNEEMRSALDQRVRERNFRVIPLLLPGAKLPNRGGLPRFLSRLTWVDFRKGLDDAEAFHLLVCGVKGTPPGRTDPTPAGLPAIECPYRGLEVFDEAHAPFFFGREAMSDHLVEALRNTCFLAVVGASGSGKSSLARAGLLPKLRADALPSSGQWTYFVFRPGNHPLQELAITLSEAGKNRDSVALLKSLEDDERALHLQTRLKLVEQAKSGRLVTENQARNARVFFLIDQFEEVFTHCQIETERVQFIRNLRYAGTIDGGQSVIVITMRADFLASALAYSDLADLLSGRQFNVSPMDESDLRRAIEEPANKAGLRFEEGLVDRVLRDVGREPGALPLMEHALLQLFEQRRNDNVMTLQAYDQSGGVHGAIAKKAEAVLEEFTDEQRQIARRIMLRLTQPGEGTEDTRRRAAKYELWSGPEEQTAVEQIVEKLTSARLLAANVDASGEQQVDVAHEALIRGWPRLRDWIDHNRAGLRIHQQLTEAAREWRRQSRDESFLYRGVKLDQATEWRKENEAALNESEREFIDASGTQRLREEEEREERQRRDLEAAQTLAAAEKQRAETAESLAKTEHKARQQLLKSLVGLVVLLLLAIFAAGYAFQQRQIAEEQQRIAEEKELKSRRLKYIAKMNLALKAYEDSNFIRANQILDSFLPPNTESTLRGFEWYYLRPLCRNEFATLQGHTDPIYAVAFSPEGNLLITGGYDNTVKIWDMRTRQEVATLHGHTDSVRSVAFSPDGRTLVTGSNDSTVKLWDVNTRKGLATLNGQDSPVYSVAVSPDGNTLAAGSRDNTVKLWNIKMPEGPPHSVSGHGGPVYSVVFSPDGKMMATGSGDKTVRLWDAITPRELATLKGHTEIVLSVAFSPDGRLLASGSNDSTVKLWETRTHKKLREFQGGVLVSSVAFSPDGALLAGASNDGRVKLWNLSALQELATLKGHTDSVNSVAFSPDSKRLATGSEDKTAKLWNILLQPTSPVFGVHTEFVKSVAFSPDGKTLATGSGDKTVKLWDTNTRRVLATIRHSGSVRSVAFSPDGKTLATGSDGDAVKLWDMAKQRELATKKHPGSVKSVAFSPDGKTLASGSSDSTVKLWDVKTQEELATFEGHEGDVYSVSFSPDGNTLATGSKDSFVKLWDTRTKSEIKTLEGHEGFVHSVAFSPDGKTLATGSMDKTVRLWDTSRWRELLLLKGYAGIVWSVAFSPDGKRLATGSQDKVVKLWDTIEWQEVATLKGHEDAVLSVTFSPDGRALATGSVDKTVRLWRAASDK